MSPAKPFRWRADLVSNDQHRMGGTLAAHAIDMVEMLDRAALQHLVCTYGHAIDRHDYPLLRTLYHPDGTDDHSPFFNGSADEYIDWLPSMMAQWSLTSHAMTNMVFLLNGDQAEGVTTARTWHRSADQSYDFIAWGRYADRFRKQDGIWRFQHRFFILESSETRPVDGADAFPTDGVALAAAGGNDPMYRGLNLIRTDREQRA